MSKLLNALGLMRVSEHERLLKESDGWLETSAWQLHDMEAKFKLAATDLSVQAAVIEKLRAENERLVRDYATRGDLIAGARTTVITLEQELASLRPDAEAMRRKRTNDAAAARQKRADRKVK